MILPDQDPTAVAGSIQATATLWAAIIAAVAAVVGATIAGFNAHKARQWVGRDQWWTRFSWAIEKSISKNPSESELGLSVAAALIDVPWAKEEDNEMAIAVVNVIVSQGQDAEQRRWWKP